jgi:hypothetical protein
MSKIKFNSFAVMQSGQKSNTVNAEPQLIANTTLGKFVITAPVSKALNIAVGENVMFLNNIADVEKAIAERNPELVGWAEENGINFIYDNKCTEAIAKKALELGIGAKGIKKILEHAFEMINYEVFANDNYSELTITPETFDDNKKFILK